MVANTIMTIYTTVPRGMRIYDWQRRAGVGVCRAPKRRGNGRGHKVRSGGGRAAAVQGKALGGRGLHV